MKSKLFKKELMKDLDQIHNWQEVVEQGVDLLVKNNYATKELARAIFDVTKKFGAYYVLEKGLALLHAPPGSYAKKAGVSCILLPKNIEFNNEQKYARVIFTLSAPDHTSHMHLIEEFGHIFTNNDVKNKILHAKSVAHILQIVNEFNKP